MSDIRYDPEKFRELIVYIASQFDDDPSLGDVKLNKILFFSDFLAYNRRAKAITGARYQKQRLGPIAVPLLKAREQLVSALTLKARLPSSSSIQLSSPIESSFSRNLIAGADLGLVAAAIT